MRLPARLLKRKPDTHKGDYGYVFVLGGSIGLTGAVCLCAQAALRCGAGRVTVGVPASLNQIFETKLTEVMSLPLPEDVAGYLSPAALERIKSETGRINVMAVGCGASLRQDAQNLMQSVISEIDLPMVVDADGINALDGNLKVLAARKNRQALVLTPHFGEFSRLIGLKVEQIKQNRKELAKEFALKYNLVLVLKGNQTIVTSGKQFYENTTGNPGMATAGSGDVLTGMIAALLAQGLSVFDAAKFAVYLHGLSGDIAGRSFGQMCLIASDIIECLPAAVKKSANRG